MSLNVEGGITASQDRNLDSENAANSSDEEMEVEEEQPAEPQVEENAETAGVLNSPSVRQTAEAEGSTPAQEVRESVEHEAEGNNSTPTEGRTIDRVNQVVIVDSPDEFQDEFKAKSSKRAKVAKSPLKSPVKEDEAQCCPICFEPWSNSGSHRLASLACGHLFGKSCIERWLKGKGSNEKCPQCNAPARRKDIRNIYAKALKTIDTTERDRALAELDKEKQLRQKAEEAEARALLQYQLVRAECERMKITLLQQQEMRLASSSCSCACKRPNAETKTVGEASSQAFTSNKCYILQGSSQISKGGSRVMSFDEHHALLVISKPSANQLFPGFGVVKVSSLDVKHSEFVQIHQKPLRDACFSCQGDGLLLTAGMDKTVKITSMISNTVVQSYSTPVPAWSCAWNNSDSNYMYSGLMNGSCLMFDVRNTNTFLKNLQTEGDSSCPVISLAHVKADISSKLRPGGLIVCKLGGACFWESTFGVDYVPHSLMLPEGSCTSLSFEPKTRHSMFSLRPSKNFPKTRHVVCELYGNGIGVSTARAQSDNNPGPAPSEAEGSASNEGSLITCNAKMQCIGGPVQKLLSRSALFTNPDDTESLIVAAPDESAKATLLWDGITGNKLQKLPYQGEPVLDVIPFAVNGHSFLTTITEQKLDVYRWQ